MKPDAHPLWYITERGRGLTRENCTAANHFAHAHQAYVSSAGGRPFAGTNAAVWTGELANDAARQVYCAGYRLVCSVPARLSIASRAEDEPTFTPAQGNEEAHGREPESAVQGELKWPLSPEQWQELGLYQPRQLPPMMRRLAQCKCATVTVLSHHHTRHFTHHVHHNGMAGLLTAPTHRRGGVWAGKWRQRFSLFNGFRNGKVRAGVLYPPPKTIRFTVAAYSHDMWSRRAVGTCLRL